MSPLFHVTSAANRESIRSHGLDWTRMGAARGIAGSMTPEENGVFLCRDEFEARFFTGLNNTGGPVDVWVVTGVEESGLVTGGSGFCYFPAAISPAQVTLADWPQGQSVTGAARGQRKNKQRKKTPRPGK
jgi:hypothetical protein